MATNQHYVSIPEIRYFDYQLNSNEPSTRNNVGKLNLVFKEKIHYLLKFVIILDR